MTSTALVPPSLAELSSDSLTSRLHALVGEERRCVVDFLLHLGELERRELHLELGFSTLFDYCHLGLNFTRSKSWRRTTSARLVRSFPVAADYLADGRLCMTTLVLLKDLLTHENCVDLLDRAAGKKEDEVKVLVATLQPRPEVRESIRRVPVRASATSAPLATFVMDATPPTSVTPSPPESSMPVIASLGTCNVESAVPSSGPELRLNIAVAEVAAPPPAPPRPKLEPIDAERYSLKLTVGPEFMAVLAEARALLSHRIPDGNLEAVLRASLQKLVEVHGRRKHAQTSEDSEPSGDVDVSGEPAPAPEASVELARSGPRSRYIPAAVRRAVWKRDGGCCSFIGADGRRCGSKHQLEYDHLQPFAQGGEATVENVALRCRAHNQFRARQHFGTEHMARFTREARAPAQAQVGLFDASPPRRSGTPPA